MSFPRHFTESYEREGCFGEATLCTRAGAAVSGGFTLLEVVIAIAVLAVLVLGTMFLLVPVSRQARINHELRTADAEA